MTILKCIQSNKWIKVDFCFSDCQRCWLNIIHKTGCDYCKSHKDISVRESRELEFHLAAFVSFKKTEVQWGPMVVSGIAGAVVLKRHKTRCAWQEERNESLIEMQCLDTEKLTVELNQHLWHSTKTKRVITAGLMHFDERHSCCFCSCAFSWGKVPCCRLTFSPYTWLWFTEKGVWQRHRSYIHIYCIKAWMAAKAKAQCWNKTEVSSGEIFKKLNKRAGKKYIRQERKHVLKLSLHWNGLSQQKQKKIKSYITTDSSNLHNTVAVCRANARNGHVLLLLWKNGHFSVLICSWMKQMDLF